jgi:ribonuclease BN (tRNA processing enzyme)
MARKADVKTVILTHIGPTTDPNDTFARYIDEVPKSFCGKALIADDLKSFPLPL